MIGTRHSIRTQRTEKKDFFQRAGGECGVVWGSTMWGYFGFTGLLNKTKQPEFGRAKEKKKEEEEKKEKKTHKWPFL